MATMAETFMIEGGGRFSVSTTDIQAQEEFCARWKNPVFAFCRMFLGDGTTAEELTCEVLLAFCRQRSWRLDDRELLPRALGFALRAANKYRTESSRPMHSGSQLEVALRDLPHLERAVVIMRNLLRMDWESIALASDLSQAQAHQIWKRGFIQLTELLQRGLSKEGH